MTIDNTSPASRRRAREGRVQVNVEITAEAAERLDAAAVPYLDRLGRPRRERRAEVARRLLLQALGIGTP